MKVRVGLYASQAYVQERGMLEEGKWEGHRFVGGEAAMDRAPHFKWMERHVPAEFIKYRASHLRPMQDAVAAGAGIGFVDAHVADADPQFVEMLPCRPEWEAETWLVTHVDLHRTAKVQTLVKYLREHAKDAAETAIS